jgi:hypothetical protein
VSDSPTRPRAQASSDTVVKFPAQGRWANSPKEHTRKICTFAFKQLNRDHELSAHARSVAIDIAEHVNWKDGFAKVSTKETAKRLGYKEETVIHARDQAVARGHFEFTPGKAGSGHSARYRPILKLPIPGEENLRAAEYFDGEKTSVSRKENLRSAEIKPPRGGVEQSYNNLSNNKSAPSGAHTVRVDREEKAFRQLIELRPLSDPSQEPAARAAYGALLKTTSIDEIIDEACSFEKRPEDCVSFLAYLASNKPTTAASS